MIGIYGNVVASIALVCFIVRVTLSRCCISWAGVGAMEPEAKRDQGEIASESLLVHGKPSCENGNTHGWCLHVACPGSVFTISLCSAQCLRQCD